MNKIIIIASITLTICAYGLKAQIKATTESGKPVLLNSDGTWQYNDDNSKEASSINLSDCSSQIKISKDKMTDKTTIFAPTEPIILTETEGEEAIALTWMVLHDNTLVLSIIAIGEGCIDEKAMINLLFRDGTKHQFFANNDFNCDGRATVYFGGIFGKKKELRMFREKSLEAIRVRTMKSHIDQTFTQQQSDLFKSAINCLGSQGIYAVGDDD
jgi:hypothetical protein